MISLSDLRPKFFVFSISGSVFCTSSRMVRMLAFFRQLYERTESSSSSTLLSRCSLPAPTRAGSLEPSTGCSSTLVEVDEDVQVIAHQLGGQRHGVVRRHRAVGPDIERQLVVVGGLAQTRRLDEVVHLLHRRVHRVNRNPADAEVLVEVLVGRDIAAPALDPQLHVQLAALGDGRNVCIRLEDFDVGVGLDVARPHFAGLVDAEVQRLGVVDVAGERNLLQVEDDVGRVLDDALNGRELVQHAVDLDGGDRRAFDRRQQHAAQRVANRGAEAAFKRLGIKTAEAIGEGFALEFEPLGTLKTFPHVFFLSGRQPGLQTCRLTASLDAIGAR